jgi:hypothetical protein
MNRTKAKPEPTPHTVRPPITDSAGLDEWKQDVTRWWGEAAREFNPFPRRNR